MQDACRKNADFIPGAAEISLVAESSAGAALSLAGLEEGEDPYLRAVIDQSFRKGLITGQVRVSAIVVVAVTLAAIDNCHSVVPPSCRGHL